MMSRWCRYVIGVAALAGFVLTTGRYVPRAHAADAVSNAAAVHAAVLSSLKLVRNWLDDKDFVSAAQASTELATIARLYAYQGTDDAWRKRGNAFQEVCGRLGDAVRRKSAADADKAYAECERLLSDLGRNPPTGARADFKAFGTNKTWMLLVEGTYRDAKRADSAREMELQIRALAEEMTVVAGLHSDAKWRGLANDVREAALRVAPLATGTDLAPARKALKEVYQRCEVCHQGNKR